MSTSHLLGLGEPELLGKKVLFFIKYPVACYAGSTLKQNLLPKGEKFRNTPQLAAVIGILKILQVY